MRRSLASIALLAALSSQAHAMRRRPSSSHGPVRIIDGDTIAHCSRTPTPTCGLEWRSTRRKSWHPGYRSRRRFRTGVARGNAPRSSWRPGRPLRAQRRAQKATSGSWASAICPTGPTSGARSIIRRGLALGLRSLVVRTLPLSRASRRAGDHPPRTLLPPMTRKREAQLGISATTFLLLGIWLKARGSPAA